MQDFRSPAQAALDMLNQHRHNLHYLLMDAPILPETGQRDAGLIRAYVTAEAVFDRALAALRATEATNH